jgi:hypothetical protein
MAIIQQNMTNNLKELLNTLINPSNNWKTDLLYRWKEIIGPLHTKIRIEKIQNDTLILGASHPCWMQELYLLSPLLMKTINEKLDQPYIKQIRFKQVSFKKDTAARYEKKIKHQKEVILTHADEYALAKIKDPTLRSALKAFRIRCYQE